MTANYQTASVFQSYGIDFCCGGNITVEKACEKKGIDPDEVYTALGNTVQSSNGAHNYNQWSLEFLIDYIINNHHTYVRSKMPEIDAFARKVAKVHGRRHPELNEIQQLVKKLYTEILDHLEKEEKDVFPYIQKLNGGANGVTFSSEEAHYDYEVHPVTLMEEEHDEAGGIMERIQELSEDFSPPQDACTTYRLLFKYLEDFQKDLHKHVHLENNILFPKALKLEKS